MRKGGTPKPPKATTNAPANATDATTASEEAETEDDLVADAAAEPVTVEETALDRILPPSEKHLVTYRDPVRRFVEEARRNARLDETEERELGRAARNQGDLDAARRLVVHNLRLVVAIAYQYRQAWLNVLDLF
jgi:RNA polymerase sigma-32 factor